MLLTVSYKYIYKFSYLIGKGLTQGITCSSDRGSSSFAPDLVNFIFLSPTVIRLWFPY